MSFIETNLVVSRFDTINSNDFSTSWDLSVVRLMILWVSEKFEMTFLKATFSRVSLSTLVERVLINLSLLMLEFSIETIELSVFSLKALERDSSSS